MSDRQDNFVIADIQVINYYNNITTSPRYSEELKIY